MITGRINAIPNEDNRPVFPSTWKTMGDSFLSAWTYPLSIVAPSADAANNVIQASRQLDEAANYGPQGWFQWSAGKVAGFAGGMLSPPAVAAAFVGGPLGGKAVQSGIGLLGRYAPAAAVKVGTDLSARTIGDITGLTTPEFVAKKVIGDIPEAAGKAFGAGTGFTAPEEIANTYDEKNNKFNVWGGMKAAFADGGLTMMIPAVPYLAGGIWGKIFRRAGKDIAKDAMPMHKAGSVPEGVEPSHPALREIDEAVANKSITPEQGTWAKAYVTGSKTPQELEAHATEMLTKEGHDVDTANQKVRFRIARPDDIDNMQQAYADAMAGNLPENIRNTLTKYMINTTLDGVRDQSGKLDNLQGVIHWLKDKLSTAPEDRINLHELLRKFLPESMRGENPFTQSKLYRALKSNKGIPGVIPKEVESLLLHEQNVKQLENKISNYNREYVNSGRTAMRTKAQRASAQLEELKAKQPKLLTHAEEIAKIRNDLYKDDKPKKNFELHPSYDRLHDLTRVRNDARRLMHELHLDKEYALHHGYADFLESMTRLMRASTGALADKNSVVDYMKARIQHHVPNLEPVVEKETKLANEVKRVEQQTTDSITDTVEDTQTKKIFNDDVIPQYDRQMAQASTDVRAGYDAAKVKFKKFNESRGVFNNLIKCVQGSS